MGVGLLNSNVHGHVGLLCMQVVHVGKAGGCCHSHIDTFCSHTHTQAMTPSIALTVFLTVGSYIPITIIISEWRATLRREMNQTEQVRQARYSPL